MRVLWSLSLLLVRRLVRTPSYDPPQVLVFYAVHMVSMEISWYSGRKYAHLYQPRMMRKWSNGEIAIDRGKPLRQNPVLLLLLSTTNSTLNALVLNSGYRGKKPETNRLDLSL
jgi:hypothetical protein